MTIADLSFAEILSSYILPWSTRVFFALAIFFAGRWIAKRVSLLIRKLMQRAEADPMLVGFIGNIVYWLGLVVVIIAALEQLGVNTTSALAVLGAAGLAVGLALKDSLTNVASGVMLILFRPFRTGHYVDAGGISGTVKEVGLFTTRLLTPDNRDVIIPNAQIYGTTITNFSANETRRIDLLFGISYSDDIGQAKQIIQRLIEEDERILSEPAPVIAVSELADSSVNLVARPWVQTADYWAVRFALVEGVKLAFDAEGVSIPFPQRDVHIHQAAA